VGQCAFDGVWRPLVGFFQVGARHWPEAVDGHFLFRIPPLFRSDPAGRSDQREGGWKASLHICHGELIRIQDKTEILNADLALVIEINIRIIAHFRRIIGVIE
jgi:hypothetical protein